MKNKYGNWMFLSCVIAATPVFATPVLAAPTETQDARLDQILAGRNMPLTLTANQLDGNYRRLNVGGQSDMIGWQMMMMGARAGVDLGLYYTRGDTVTLGGESYLIAYRPQVRIDPAIFQHHGDGDDAPPPSPKLRANAKLSLSLLNLRTTTSLNDIRPFDPQQDVETAQESNAASVRNLERLGRGLMVWLNNRGDGTLPEIGATSTPQFQRRFYPFVHDQRLWLHPGTEEPYRPNPALSRKNIRQIINKQYVVFFSEATPAADGTRAVLFLDGHVERVDAERWQRLQQVKIVTRAASASVPTVTTKVTVAVPPRP